MNRRAEHDISRILKVLNHAKEIRNISKTCRYFGICRETFYSWRRAYEAQGEKGLIDSRPCPENHILRIAKSIEEKIIYLRTHYILLRSNGSLTRNQVDSDEGTNHQYSIIRDFHNNAI